MVEQFEDRIHSIEKNILLTLEDVANVLDVPVNAIRDWARIGILPSLPIGPSGELRFRMNDVITLIMERVKRELGIEKPIEEMDDEVKRYKLELEYLVSTFDAHVDEAKQLVETELIPYVYKYTELCSNPRPESRFREEDFRFLLPK